MTPIYDWPDYGMRSAFFNQTRENTEREPGAHKIPVNCLQCGEDFFVVWDRDPRPNAIQKQQETRDGIKILEELIQGGVLFEKDQIDRAVDALRAEGQSGINKLTRLMRDLLNCRSPKMLKILDVAGRMEPDQELTDLLLEIKNAPELKEIPENLKYQPGKIGDGMIGWGEEDMRRKSQKIFSEYTGVVVSPLPPSSPGADMDGEDFAGDNFESRDLGGASIRGANLEGAILRFAQLSGADLEGANLRDANLYFANLQRTNLRNTNLRGANLYSSDLENAQLEGADLTDAYGPNNIKLPDGNFGGVMDLKRFTLDPDKGGD
jgi:hypothetical protein